MAAHTPSEMCRSQSDRGQCTPYRTSGPQGQPAGGMGRDSAVLRESHDDQGCQYGGRQAGNCRFKKWKKVIQLIPMVCLHVLGAGDSSEQNEAADPQGLPFRCRQQANQRGAHHLGPCRPAELLELTGLVLYRSMA